MSGGLALRRLADVVPLALELFDHVAEMMGRKYSFGLVPVDRGPGGKLGQPRLRFRPAGPRSRGRGRGHVGGCWPAASTCWCEHSGSKASDGTKSFSAIGRQRSMRRLSNGCRWPRAGGIWRTLRKGDDRLHHEGLKHGQIGCRIIDVQDVVGLHRLCSILGGSRAPYRYASARRPASVILTRVRSIGLSASNVRSGSAIAKPHRTKPTIMSSLNPPAISSASVVPLRLAGEHNHTTTRMKSEALLVGRIFDDRGNRMSPSHARKRGVKYRYYLSSALLQGQAELSGSIRRVPAAEIEALVIRSVREHLKLKEATDDKDFVNNHVERVEIQPDHLAIRLTQTQTTNRQRAKGSKTIHVPWHKTESTRRREILLSGPTPPKDSRPIRSETRATLVSSIARGRRWLDELKADPIANVEAIAKREGCSARKVNMTISLAFLAPDLVKAAIEGRLPRGMGVARLCDMPAEWSRQRQILGLASAEAR
jgi:hypothetical protein